MQDDSSLFPGDSSVRADGIVLGVFIERRCMNGGSPGALSTRASPAASQPSRQERLEPGGNAAVMLEPTSQMLPAAQPARPGQAVGSTMRPPAQHVIGSLQGGTACRPHAGRSDRRGWGNSSRQPRAARCLQADRSRQNAIGRRCAGSEAEQRRSHASVGSDRIIADLAALIVITEHARASICAPRQRPSSGLSSASGVSSQSISRLTQSSVSLAPIGPPNATTPS